MSKKAYESPTAPPMVEAPPRLLVRPALRAVRIEAARDLVDGAGEAGRDMDDAAVTCGGRGDSGGGGGGVAGMPVGILVLMADGGCGLGGVAGT